MHFLGKLKDYTVELGNKERFDKEQIGIKDLNGLPTLSYC